MSKYCKFPWTWKNVNLKTDDWRFCCKVPYLPYNRSVVSETSTKIGFINHELPNACTPCWKDEDNSGGVSYRTIMYGKASHDEIVKLESEDSTLEWIDIQFGDLCNMHCMICGPYNSTNWKNILGIPVVPDDKFSSAWPKLVDLLKTHKKTLRHLNAYGGEPSVDPTFYKLVNGLLELDFVSELHIYTNGNYSESHKNKFENAIEKLLEKGWKIELSFSVDGVGEDVEYMRGGLNFKRLEENLKFAANTKVKTFVNVSMSMLNIEKHYDVYKWVSDIGLAEKVFGRYNLVSNPHRFSIAILGNKLKEFLPFMPENMSSTWDAYNSQIKKLIDEKTSGALRPDVVTIKSFIEGLDVYSKQINIPITPYYLDYIKRLEHLIQSN